MGWGRGQPHLPAPFGAELAPPLALPMGKAVPGFYREELVLSPHVSVVFSRSGEA